MVALIVDADENLSSYGKNCRPHGAEHISLNQAFVRGTILIVVLQVECYSGAKADERPVRFRLDDTVFFIEEVLDQWYGPDDTFFKVRVDDGNLYILRRDQSIPEGTWSLTSFRRLEREEKSP